MTSPRESLFALITPNEVAEAGAVQDHESLVDAYFRVKAERVEFQSEGWCGPMCPCQVKCRPALGNIGHATRGPGCQHGA